MSRGGRRRKKKGPKAPGGARPAEPESKPAFGSFADLAKAKGVEPKQEAQDDKGWTFDSGDARGADEHRPIINPAANATRAMTVPLMRAVYFVIDARARMPSFSSVTPKLPQVQPSNGRQSSGPRFGSAQWPKTDDS